MVIASRGLISLLRLCVLHPQDKHDLAKESAMLSSALGEANLDQLAAALQLPKPPATKPEDSEGYFTGLLRDGTDPMWTPAMFYDPAALDLTNADCSHLEPLDQYPVPRQAATTSAEPSSAARPRKHRRRAAREASSLHEHEGSAQDHSQQNGQAVVATSPQASHPLPAESLDKAYVASSARTDSTSKEAMPGRSVNASDDSVEPSGQEIEAPSQKMHHPASDDQGPEASASEPGPSQPESNQQPTANSKGWFGNMLSGGWISSLGRSRSTAELPPEPAAPEPGEAEWTSKSKAQRKKKKKKAATAANASQSAADGRSPDAAAATNAANPASPRRAAPVTVMLRMIGCLVPLLLPMLSKLLLQATFARAMTSEFK